MNDGLTAAAAGFLLTGVTLILLARLAPRLGLVDRPDGRRKLHEEPVPTVGGPAIFLALVATAALGGWEGDVAAFLATGGCLVAVGALDDRFHLPVGTRAAVEFATATWMVFGAGVYVSDLGSLVGFAPIALPIWLAYPFTLVAVFGILNAINMIDGLDGLAGSVVLAALLVLLALADHPPSLTLLGPALAGALAAFLTANLRLVSALPRVFLGDGGSKLLGFALVWWLIAATQDPAHRTPLLAPATTLYLVGLPLMDMVAVTLRRLRKGVSPFAPERTHLHHVLLRAGFAPRVVLAAIVAASAALNALGVALAAAGAPEAVQFALFLGLFAGYCRCVPRLLRLRRH
ncbi:MAG: undecaprenyl-phosphate alpha-N-acetylglucosaminyl 1-phosphate transferase [Porticoccaceae bacterium]|nr:MAG: undecaprenyl-phosphate alpha-N-acetylglucosaminyl 1-phosphate transferase [Porticoccaceae bacterium]